jgi:hypothetical protein
MTERIYELILAMLAVWRVTHLVTMEDGPWRIVARARERLARWSVDGARCFYCMSVWVAGPPALWIGRSTDDRLLSWLALSGAAILLERATQPVAPAEYVEHPAARQGDDDVWVRQGQ